MQAWAHAAHDAHAPQVSARRPTHGVAVHPGARAVTLDAVAPGTAAASSSSSSSSSNNSHGSSTSASSSSNQDPSSSGSRNSSYASTSASSSRPASSKEYERFEEAVRGGANVVPLCRRIFADQLTPVLAYRCLVKESDVSAPSFLLESVVNGDQQGRYSFLGAMPAMEVIACQNKVTVLDHVKGTREVSVQQDPMLVPEAYSRAWKPASLEGLPQVFTGGWVGYAGYDTVRYVYSGKLPFETAAPDDRGLNDMHLALYNDVVVFDQATKIAYAISWVHVGEEELATPSALRAAYEEGSSRVDHLVSQLSTSPSPQLPPGVVALDLGLRPACVGQSNMTKEEFLQSVLKGEDHITAGDVFQLVLSQRFERRTFAEPFEIYRALRVVNPSPYMVYMQCRGCILVSSSPEILTRVDKSRIVTNRPLAGTRPRGATPAADKALEVELLADEKERAEHIMLVDLGRNDVGKVSVSGSVVVEKLMEVERYSHVMHISSTVTGQLLPELDCWDALRAALPAGTISGAPKVRAMQIIDNLEATRRGPYGGGIGHVSFTGAMDMALALRTMVISTADQDTMYRYDRSGAAGTHGNRREWVVHIQAGAGVVADSIPDKEYEETVNKAAALGRAVDLAEEAFVGK